LKVICRGISIQIGRDDGHAVGALNDIGHATEACLGAVHRGGIATDRYRRRLVQRARKNHASPGILAGELVQIIVGRTHNVAVDLLARTIAVRIESVGILMQDGARHRIGDIDIGHFAFVVIEHRPLLGMIGVRLLSPIGDLPAGIIRVIKFRYDRGGGVQVFDFIQARFSC